MGKNTGVALGDYFQEPLVHEASLCFNFFTVSFILI